MVVFKYPAPFIGAPATIQMPVDAKVIHAGEQYGQINLWAQIPDQPAPMEERTFIILGTGHPFYPPNGLSMHHIGTVVTQGGALVWHVFEIVTTVRLRNLGSAA